MKLFFYCLLILSAVFTVNNGVSQDDVDKLIRTGNTRFNAGNYDEAIVKYSSAIDHFKKAESNSTDLQNTLLKRAQCYVIQTHYDEALLDFNYALEMNPENKFAHNSRGSVYLKQKKYKEAELDFTKVLSMDSEDAQAHNNRGWAYLGMGDKNKACSDWKFSKKHGNEEAKIILKDQKCK